MAEAALPLVPLLHVGEPAGPRVGLVLFALREDGWVPVDTTGCHRQFRHPAKSGRATIAGKPGDDFAVGTYLSILKQARLRR